MKVTWKKLLTLSLLSMTAMSWANENKLTLDNCHLGEIRSQVKCGKLEVPENYQKPEGDKISVNFAVLPAIDDSEYKVPLMFLAGGPGQAATELAMLLNRAFREVRKTRDIILVDQRGTGESHALSCDLEEEGSVYSTLTKDFKASDVNECVSQFKGDLSQYNSENAIRDFDAVRAALGHEKLNIYGGSYGTRAGLVYMRMFPESLESVVLDGVGPIEVPIGLFGQSVERAFNLLVENCQKSEPCHQAFPNLAKEFQQVKLRLASAPVSIDIQHPRLGTPTKFVLDDEKFTTSLRMQLYSTSGRSLVPLVINQAYLGNYQPLIGLMASTEGEQQVYTGLHFNIVCNEDVPRISEKMKAVDATNSFDGDTGHFIFDSICPLIPKYRPSDDFYQSVTADIPTLILSGNLDPVTPPSNGEYSAKSLPNSHHIVAKNTAHIVATSTCANDIVNEFLTTKDPKALDESCLDDIPEETFMTSVNGIQ
ncbi:alpha/beta hydrolase [Colwellia sp. 75C3]|uniref:alpha/beta hydrolase n=1 Tax=Colwellia sp. 75C3 TaxID=888425 RepID=UPI000C31DD0D|nr:alpha/beta hydrolase [Colwellia sp. 75C3]PKG82433.1 alpha/beta hydrolase [Colwellia sp. 75C3]